MTSITVILEAGFSQALGFPGAASIDWRSALPDPERQRIQLVFDRRARQYDKVGIATLNYDLGAEAFQSHYTDGFSGDGAYQYFSPAKFLKHDTGVRIGHLRGSIAYGILEAPPTLVKINGLLDPRRVPLWMPLKDGSLYAGVITGHDKPNKLLMQPYSVYFAWFAEQLLHSNRLLVIGYGVGDVHLNVWLMTAVRHHAMEDLRCVIVDHFDPLSDETPRIMYLYAYATGRETPLTAEQRRAMAFDRGIARREHVANDGADAVDAHAGHGPALRYPACAARIRAMLAAHDATLHGARRPERIGRMRQCTQPRRAGPRRNCISTALPRRASLVSITGKADKNTGIPRRGFNPDNLPRIVLRR